jgi:hypothetical protein
MPTAPAAAAVLVLAALLAVSAADDFSVACVESAVGGGGTIAGVAGRHTAVACKITAGIAPDATAVAQYSDAVNTTGWYSLSTQAVDAAARPQLLAYARGFLEGYATAQPMCDFGWNSQTGVFQGNATLQGQVQDWIMQNYEWLAAVATNGSVGAYWSQLAVTLSQVEGVAAGYAASSLPATCDVDVDLAGVLMLNAGGDLYDIISVVTQSWPDYEVWDAVSMCVCLWCVHHGGVGVYVLVRST